MTTLGSRNVGDEFQVLIDGVAWDFIIAHKGNPDSSLYPSEFDNGVIVMMKDLYESRQWHTSLINDYGNSAISLWLENDFYNLINPVISAQIIQVRVPTADGMSGAVYSGTNGLIRKVFLLAGREVGSGAQTNLPNDGATLDYFTGIENISANSRRVALLNGTVSEWWLRTPQTSTSTSTWYIAHDSTLFSNLTNNSYGVRPSFVLPSTFDPGPGHGTNTGQLNVTISPPEADQGVTLTSSNIAVATVNQAGFVEAVGAGIATITARSTSDSTRFGTSLITVTEVPRPPTVGDRGIGDIVQIPISGTMWDFLVVHKGSPSALYAGFDNTVTLMMKDLYGSNQWHTSNVNDYQYSTLNIWLNNHFLNNLIDSNVRTQIVQVRIPFRAGSGTSSTVTSGTSGLLSNVFLLAGREVGSGAMTNLPDDGATLDYFAGIESSGASNRRIALLNGPATSWWLRSPATSNIANAYYIHLDGSLQTTIVSSMSENFGVRPCFVLPASANL